jgi:hypothetical protein
VLIEKWASPSKHYGLVSLPGPEILAQLFAETIWTVDNLYIVSEFESPLYDFLLYMKTFNFYEIPIKFL